ncbi:hypothetical protein [Sphingomonas ursincola]|uniref:Uncharacterized protein n=1 Tax=Sphingomonas ursincola TaxID=56361 RepID=A0A7V8RAJ0_9SPHN|nr:hypothetical protein [Sphingomonas ursincola]MBA1372896.1 hypothetical protein [Sphingomonas ursincola]
MRLAVPIERLKPAITLVGWVGFALVTADYAGFIDLPVLIQIPLWLAIVTSICRWALWEGLIKPKLTAPPEKALAPDELKTSRDDEC